MKVRGPTSDGGGAGGFATGGGTSGDKKGGRSFQDQLDQKQQQRPKESSFTKVAGKKPERLTNAVVASVLASDGEPEAVPSAQANEKLRRLNQLKTRAVMNKVQQPGGRAPGPQQAARSVAARAGPTRPTSGERSLEVSDRTVEMQRPPITRTPLPQRPVTGSSSIAGLEPPEEGERHEATQVDFDGELLNALEAVETSVSDFEDIAQDNERTHTDRTALGDDDDEGVHERTVLTTQGEAMAHFLGETRAPRTATEQDPGDDDWEQHDATTIGAPPQAPADPWNRERTVVQAEEPAAAEPAPWTPEPDATQQATAEVAEPWDQWGEDAAWEPEEPAENRSEHTMVDVMPDEWVEDSMEVVYEEHAPPPGDDPSPPTTRMTEPHVAADAPARPATDRDAAEELAVVEPEALEPLEPEVLEPVETVEVTRVDLRVLAAAPVQVEGYFALEPEVERDGAFIDEPRTAGSLTPTNVEGPRLPADVAPLTPPFAGWGDASDTPPKTVPDGAQKPAAGARDVSGPRELGPREITGQREVSGPREPGPREITGQREVSGPREAGPREITGQREVSGPREAGPREITGQREVSGPREAGPREITGRREVTGPREVGPREVTGPREVGPREVTGPREVGPREVGPREVTGPREVGPREVTGPREVGPREVTGPREVGPREATPVTTAPRPGPEAAPAASAPAEAVPPSRARLSRRGVWTPEESARSKPATKGTGSPVVGESALDIKPGAGKPK